MNNEENKQETEITTQTSTEQIVPIQNPESNEVATTEEVVNTAVSAEAKEEMQAVEVGKIQEPKKGNFFGLILFFVVLIGVVIGLPYIEDFFNKTKEPSPPINNNTNPNTNDNQDDKNKITSLHIDSAHFTVDNLEFSDFKVNSGVNHTISFIVGTSVDTGTTLGTNLFLELYAADNKLLERVKIEKNIVIAKSSPVTMEFNITQNSSSNVTNILVINKGINEYPAVTLNKDGEGNQILICVNNSNKITYYFNESKLSKMEDVITYYKGYDLDEYLNLLNNKKSEAKILDSREGFSSLSLEFTDGSGFTVNTTIDLDMAVLTAQDLPIYYRKDVLAKMVAFEMQARGYNCN